jgi:hypothetical protein
VNPVGLAPIALGDVIIIGGGCYGTFYTRQLEAARVKGKVSYSRLINVDRDPQCSISREPGTVGDRQLAVADWGEFLDHYLAQSEGTGNAVIVPSPLMPHLMYEWLLRRARSRWPGRVVETRPLTVSPRTPYDSTAPDHTRYISFADWICPTHCIEPALCPVIRAPRTWEMAEEMEQLTVRLNRQIPTAGPIVFQCRHTVFGVGTFSVAAVLAGDRVVAETGASGRAAQVAVGTISSCHGAVNVLYLGETGNR